MSEIFFAKIYQRISDITISMASMDFFLNAADVAKLFEFKCRAQLLNEIVNDGNERLSDDTIILVKENLLLSELSAPERQAFKENHSVRFFTAAQLSNILMEKNKTGRLHSFFSSLKKIELIVLDEIGFIPIHKEAS